MPTPTLTLLQLAKIGWKLEHRLHASQLLDETLPTWEDDAGIRFVCLDRVPLVEEHVQKVLLELGEVGQRDLFGVELLHITEQSQVHAHEKSASFFFGRGIPSGARMYSATRRASDEWTPIEDRISLGIKAGTLHAFDASVAERSYYVVALSTPPFQTDDVITL